MFQSFYCLRYFTCLLSLLLTCTSAAVPADKERIVRLRVAAEQTYRATPNWQRQIAATVAKVSRIYATEFGIRFEITDFVNWDPVKGESDVDNLLRLLPDGVTRKDADIVLGLSARPCNGQKPGVAQPFGAYILLLSTCELTKPGHTGIATPETVLSHELAHLFGAFHLKPEIPSVMNSTRADLFDSQSHRVIALMKFRDFSAGVAGIDPPTRRAWLTIFHEGYALNDINNIAVAIQNDGLRLVYAGSIAASVEKFREALAIEPDNALINTDLGEALSRLGDHQAGEQYLRKAVEIDPTLIRARNDLAQTLALLGDLQGAQAIYRQVLQQEPTNGLALLQVGIIYVMTGKPVKAIAALRAAQQHLPPSAILFENIGIAYGMTGDFETAVRMLRRAIAMDGKFQEAHANLGFTLAQQKHWKEAIAEYNKALQLKPDDQRTRVNLSNALRATGQP